MFGDTKQKYVRLSNNEVVIFPCAIEHKTFLNLKPISAGFCYLSNEKVQCYGESVSLDLKSDEKDSFFATRQIFGARQ